jgi:hypothetical protein
MKGEDPKRLVADFNRDWPEVTRTRETFVLAEEFCKLTPSSFRDIAKRWARNPYSRWWLWIL